MTKLPKSVKALNSTKGKKGYEVIEILNEKCSKIELGVWHFSDGSMVSGNRSASTFHAFGSD